MNFYTLSTKKTSLAAINAPLTALLVVEGEPYPIIVPGAYFVANIRRWQDELLHWYIGESVAYQKDGNLEAAAFFKAAHAEVLAWQRDSTIPTPLSPLLSARGKKPHEITERNIHSYCQFLLSIGEIVTDPQRATYDVLFRVDPDEALFTTTFPQFLRYTAEYVPPHINVKPAHVWGKLVTPEKMAYLVKLEMRHFNPHQVWRQDDEPFAAQKLLV